jgi:hypothetical protein
MSGRQGILFQDVVVFCFINCIYGIVPLGLLSVLLPSDTFNSFWDVGETTITATLWRVIILIALGTPIGVKFNDEIERIWDTFTS